MDFSAKMLRDDALKGKSIIVTGGDFREQD